MERMTPDTIDFNSLSKKQLVELVIGKYNDCFRLEEENKKLKKECEENDYLVEDNARWIKECGEKTKEIKKLKEENENLKAIIEHYKKFEEGKGKLEGMLI